MLTYVFHYATDSRFLTTSLNDDQPKYMSGTLF